MKKRVISNVYHTIEKYYYQCLTMISPVFNTKARYHQFFHRKLDLEHPKSLNDKLLKLKLERYINDPLVRQCADKYAVRKYIEEKGCSDILVPLIAYYDRVDDVEWDKLPDSFVMKWNFGCGFNIICSDKTKLDIKETVRKMKKWGKDKSCYLDYSEMQYKGINRKIIVEKHLTLGGALPADYKVYCFHGEPMAILYINDRDTDHKGAVFFTPEWEFLSESSKASYKHLDSLPNRPYCLEKMMEYSRKLSSPFPFVRMDYYVVDGLLYFGEMTFTPAAGFTTSQCKIQGKEMGDYLKVE